MSPDDPRHGTRAGYDAHAADGERACAACRNGARLYGKRLELDKARGITRSTDRTGTMRRVQALVALGYTFRVIGEHLGCSHDCARKLAFPGEFVRTSTAAKVDQVFERLCMTVPTGAGVRHAKATARRYGWVPPLAWDDIDTDPAPVTAEASHRMPTTEVLAEVAHLMSLGESEHQAARRLGTTVRALEKARERVRAA